MSMTWIVAGNYNEYLRWTEEKYKDGSLEVYKCVHSVDSIRGLDECHGFFIGTYKQRSDIREIEDAIKIINSRPRSNAPFGGTNITGVILDEVANTPIEFEMKVDPDTGDVMCYHRGQWVTAVRGDTIDNSK